MKKKNKKRWDNIKCTEETKNNLLTHISSFTI